MAIPVNEQIVRKISQRIQDVAESSGYETTVNGTVVRASRIWQGNLQDYQVIISQQTIERNEDLSHPGNPPATAYAMTVNVFGELRPSEETTTAIDTLGNEFGSDLIKAICSPAESWHNWDGLAILTNINTIEHVNAEEVAGVKIELEVIYRTQENDPYTVRA